MTTDEADAAVATLAINLIFQAEQLGEALSRRDAVTFLAITDKIQPLIERIETMLPECSDEVAERVRTRTIDPLMTVYSRLTEEGKKNGGQ